MYMALNLKLTYNCNLFFLTYKNNIHINNVYSFNQIVNYSSFFKI